MEKLIKGECGSYEFCCSEGSLTLEWRIMVVTFVDSFEEEVKF